MRGAETMQGRATPYIIGAAVAVILAIVGGMWLMGDKDDAGIDETETIAQQTPMPIREEPVPQDNRFQQPALEMVYFDFDRYNLRSDARRAIQQNLEWLKQHPDARVRLEGHADERGTEEYNVALGDRRAQAVKRALEDMQIESIRITTRSYGESRPEVPNARTEAEHQRNRRVVFIIEP